MSNQNQAGIDLTQAASNLGRPADSSQRPAPKKSPSAVTVSHPQLIRKDDPLLNELRKQCKRNRSKLSLLDGLCLPYGPYANIFIGSGQDELKSLPHWINILSPDWIATKNDPQEFTAPSISFMAPAQGSLLTRYQDGTIEYCQLNGKRRKKSGSFELYHPSMPYLKSESFVLGPYLLQQSGLFYQGLPCGPFKFFDENGVCLCKGCYELVEATSNEASKEICPLALYDFLKEQEQLLDIDSMFDIPVKTAEYTKWNRPLRPIKVCPNQLVVRYDALSRRLPNDQLHTFEVGPERPCVLLQRRKNETWLEACTRAHQKVLTLVQKQVNDLHQAQRAAAQLLAPKQDITADPNPELIALKEQLAVPLHDDEAGVLIHQNCLELMGKLQSADLVTGCTRGGYAQVMLDCLARTADGHYLNGVLVSSAKYFESNWRLVATPEQTSSKQTINQHFLHEADSAQKSCGMRLGHYFCNGRDVSNFKGKGYSPILIWGGWNEKPVSTEADLELLQQCFNWHALGCSSVYDAMGTCVGNVGYSELPSKRSSQHCSILGLCQGPFIGWHERKQTREDGSCSKGHIKGKLTFTMYQDYRSRFPAAIFTVSLVQNTFIGRYQCIYGIDELFEKGYHAVMLEACGTVKTEQGFKTKKRLCAYTPNTYRKEDGIYLADGTVQITKHHGLNPYQRPRPERPPWGYDDEFDEDEYKAMRAELWGDEKYEVFYI